MIETLARAAVAVGSLFLETHLDPAHAMSDGSNMLPLDRLMDRRTKIHAAIQKF